MIFLRFSLHIHCTFLLSSRDGDFSATLDVIRDRFIWCPSYPVKSYSLSTHAKSICVHCQVVHRSIVFVLTVTVYPKQCINERILISELSALTVKFLKCLYTSPALCIVNSCTGQRGYICRGCGLYTLFGTGAVQWI